VGGGLIGPMTSRRLGLLLCAALGVGVVGPLYLRLRPVEPPSRVGPHRDRRATGRSYSNMGRNTRYRWVEARREEAQRQDDLAQTRRAEAEAEDRSMAAVEEAAAASKAHIVWWKKRLVKHALGPGSTLQVHDWEFWGEVKNTSSRPIGWLEVELRSYDAEGGIPLQAGAALVEVTPLAPGASAPFKGYCPYCGGEEVRFECAVIMASEPLD